MIERQCLFGSISDEKTTYSERAVPRTRAERHAVCRDAQAADAVFVSSEHTHTLALERIPDVACPVIVSAEQDTAGDGEGDGAGGNVEEAVM